MRFDRVRPIVLFTCICLVELISGNRASGETKRTAVQIEADIKTSEGAIPSYPMADRFDPRYRQFMKGKIGPSLQHLANLYAELAKVSPARAVAMQFDRCLALVCLALYGHDDALKSLTDSSASEVPSEALFGKIGLMMYRWWNSADEATQQGIVKNFESLAKANPKEDLLVDAALTMARYQADSDGLAESLRDIVDNDLKEGAAAIKYHSQPVKLGRPFKITIKALDGTRVSTADWKGKVIVLDFWATWCPPCRAALPELIKLYQADHSKGLEVLGISNDYSLSDLKNFLWTNKGMKWPQSFSPAGPDSWNTLSQQMDVHAIPTSFLIDRNGKLRDIEVVYLDEELLNKLLDEPVKTEPIASETADAGKTGESGPAAVPVSPSSIEDPANSLLMLAKTYIDSNMPDRAKAKLNELLDKYPDSAAAPKAKELLAQLNARSN